MENLTRFIGAALLCAAIALTLRSGHKALGAAFALAAGAGLFLLLSGKLREAVDALRELAALSDMGEGSLAMILRLLGVSFACELAAQACRDAGEEGIAMRVEMGGKIALLLLCAPLIKEVAASILSLTA